MTAPYAPIRKGSWAQQGMKSLLVDEDGEIIGEVEWTPFGNGYRTDGGKRYISEETARKALEKREGVTT